MKNIALLLLSSAALYGQWITGTYAAGNGVMSVSHIPWNNYTHIIHFAAAPNSDGAINLLWLTQPEIGAIIAARPADKKVIVEIKDNDFDRNAYLAATSPAVIAVFVNNLVDFVNANGYDGVDLDWESNVNTAQYANLIARLRAAMPAKVIGMAAGNWGGLPAVAAAGQSSLDQVNVMCYDMDNDPSASWYNGGLLNGSSIGMRTCDGRVKAITNAGVVPARIGVGIPFYGRKWTGCTQPLARGCTNAGYVRYRDLVTDPVRWQSQNQGYDHVYKSNYLSIAGLNEFTTFNGVQFISDVAAWWRSNGFGGFMTFEMSYEYLPNQTGDERYPLSTALYKAAFASTGASLFNSTVESPRLSFFFGAALLLMFALLAGWIRDNARNRLKRKSCL